MWLLVVGAAIAGGNLIANGSFEEKAASGAAHWTASEGAYLGVHAPASDVQWTTDDGSVVLRLAATSATKSFTGVGSDTVPVTPGAAVVLSGRMKTAGVQPGGFDQCAIAVLFTDASGKRVSHGGIAITENLRGDHPWTTESTRVTVPPGAANAQVLASLLAPGTAWFDDLSLEVAPPVAWTTAQSEHFDFHWFAEAPLSAAMQQENEQQLAHAEKVLGVGPPAERIAFYYYASKEQKGQLTGDPGNGHSDGYAVHSIFPTQEHELVHVLTQQWGMPDTALLGEGVAVYEGGQWQGRPIDAYAKELLTAGKVPPLTSIATTRAFRAQDDLTTYAVAGSFVGYLVHLKDMDTFRRVYVKGAPLDERLKSAYGKDLVTLDADWRAWLGKQ